MHNLRFIVRLVQRIKDAIYQDTFIDFKNDFLGGYQVTDEEVRLVQKQKWLSSPRHRNDIIS
ncbi:MAG: hypothetical protein D4R82_00575 [Dehalococcoidia bacterium]|nr:MAG: hypothetical protein D4R82_00575 [Dehalococcoidia bacterium]